MTDTTVYSTSTCPFCKQLKDYLAGKNIPFKEVLVESGAEALKEYNTVADGFAGVPFTVMKKEDNSVVKVKGFNQEELEKCLNLEPRTENQEQKNSEAGTQNLEQEATVAETAQPANPEPGAVPVPPTEVPVVPDILSVVNPEPVSEMPGVVAGPVETAPVEPPPQEFTIAGNLQTANPDIG